MVANPYAAWPEHKSLQRILAVVDLGADCRRYSWALLAAAGANRQQTNGVPIPEPLRVRFARCGPVMQNAAIPMIRRWIACLLVACCRKIQLRRRQFFHLQRRVPRMTD